MNNENVLLNIINWLTSVNFDELIFKKLGPILIGLVIVFISLALAFRTKNDLSQRTNSKIWPYVAGFLVFFTSIIGYLFYLVLRPTKKLSEVEEMERKYLELEVRGIGCCHVCDTTYFADEMFCRKCGNQLRRKCVRCNNVIELTSVFCNSCGLQQLDRQEVSTKDKKKFKKEVKNKVDKPGLFDNLKSKPAPAVKEVEKPVAPTPIKEPAKPAPVVAPVVSAPTSKEAPKPEKKEEKGKKDKAKEVKVEEPKENKVDKLEDKKLEEANKSEEKGGLFSKGTFAKIKNVLTKEITFGKPSKPEEKNETKDKVEEKSEKKEDKKPISEANVTPALSTSDNLPS